MKKQGVLTGLTSLAIASGVGWYMYKKLKKNLSEPHQQLQYLRKMLFQDRTLYVDTIMNKFDHIFNMMVRFQIQEFINNNITNQEPQEIKKRYCKKRLDKQYFYECLDCSVTLKNSTAKQADKEDLTTFSHQFCEDCFEHSIHRGHKYKLMFSRLDGACDCGHSYLVDENSFCSQHSGFKKLQSSFNNEFPSNIKEITINYFKELFYTLIDGQSDLIYNEIKKQKKEINEVISDPSISIQYNIFLTIIFDQMMELMNIDNQFVFCFTQLFQMPFDKPTRLDTSADTFALLEYKQLNKNESIIEYLFRYQSQLNEQSFKNFDKIMELLSTADKHLVQYFAKKYMKLIRFAIKPLLVRNDDEQEFYIFTISQLHQTCRNAFVDQTFTKNTYLEHEDYELIPIISYQSQEEILLTAVFSQYIYDFFDLPETLQNFKRYEEFIDQLLNIQEMFFEKLQLENNVQRDIFDDLAQKAIVLIGYGGLQIQIQDIFYKITVYCHKYLSKEQKNRILKLICKRYQFSVENLFDNMQAYKFVKKEDRTYIGLSIVPLIICIVIMSEGPELSSQNLLNALKKNFSFHNQKEIDDFINKISYILSCNLMTHCYHVNGFLLLHFTQVMQQSIQSSGVVNQLWHVLLNSAYSSYDSNMLAYQLISSVQSYSQNIIQQVIDNFDECNMEQDHIVEAFILKPLNIIKQLMFDHTIFMNIDAKLENILSQNNQSIKENMVYATKQVINNLLKWQPSRAKRYSEFSQSIQFIVSNKQLVDETLPFFGSIQQDSDAIDIKPISDIEDTSVSISRFFCNLADKKLAQDNSPYIQFIIVEGFIDKLFDYQKKLVIKCFSDPLVFLKLREIVHTKEYGIEFLFYLYFYFNVWEEVTNLSETNPQLFSQYELEQTKHLKELLYSKQSSDIFYPKIKAKYERLQKRAINLPKGIHKMFDLFKRQQVEQKQQPEEIKEVEEKQQVDQRIES